MDTQGELLAGIHRARSIVRGRAAGSRRRVGSARESAVVTTILNETMAESAGTGPVNHWDVKEIHQP